MTEIDNEIIIARKKYFDNLNEKNQIDHTRIDELDLENISIILNYQQVDLINIALSSNKIGYKEYQSKLVRRQDIMTKKGQRDRYIAMLKDLIKDEEIPQKTKEVITKIYEQSKNNSTIQKSTIEDVVSKLIVKLSYDLQDLIYAKLNKLRIVEYPGIKDMSYEESLKLLKYIEEDYTSITIREESSFTNYVNPNGSYNKENMKTILDFAYENDKEVIINALISNQIPSYIKDMPKEMIKQRLVTYIDEITKYVNIYNATHKRVDRKPMIRNVTIFSDLNNNQWLSYFSIEELCEIVKNARKNLPDVLFSYNEENLEDQNNRNKLIANLAEILKYEKKHRVKLVDVLGIKMHIDLDVSKDDVSNMLKELSAYDKLLSITEFDVRPTEYMLLNNSKREIEILRNRFISDLCNVITSFSLSKTINFDSVTIDSVCDNQSLTLANINEQKLKDKKPLFRTLYCGMYDDNFERKEEFNRLGLRVKKNNKEIKGYADTLYVGLIVLGLLVVISVVILVFLKYIG